MSYPLRLPPELDAEARERCKRLGVSLNALIAIALDQYLRGAESAPAKVGRRVAAKPASKAAQQPSEPPDGPDRWKWFESPDVWPYVDPDPAWRAEFDRIAGDRDPENPRFSRDIDKAYWATRTRPPCS